MSVENNSPFNKQFRRRSRRGCLICRQHRLKCDEKRPTCGCCDRLGRTCKWGLKASFHPSRAFGLSASDSRVLGELELGRQNEITLAFIDETEDIEREYNELDEALVQHESGRGPASDSAPEIEDNPLGVMKRHHTKTWGTQDDHFAVPIGDRLSKSGPEARISASRLESTSGPLRYLHPHPPPIPDPPAYTTRNNMSLITVSVQETHHGSVSDTLYQEVLSWPINDHMKACLLSAYFQSASRWCEVTDSRKHFSTSSSHLTMKSPAFAAAAATLATITVTRRDEFSVLLTDELYTFAHSTLRGLKSEHREGGLLAATLLCMYCSALGKTTEAESILHECAELLQAHNIENAPCSVLTACFWAFARQDIWAGYLSGRPTLIPTESWLTTQSGPYVPVQDSYCNLAIWITARIVNELSKHSAEINVITLQDLWAELQMWVIERPVSVRCVMEIEASGDSAFPTILFSNPSATCGNLYYNTGCILLLTTGMIRHQPSAMTSPICHARRIAGISVTNNDHANLVNNIHSLCVAARQLPTAIEKIAILKHFREIENCTGWKTQRYILEFERLWGLR